MDQIVQGLGERKGRKGKVCPQPTGMYRSSRQLLVRTLGKLAFSCPVLYCVMSAFWESQASRCLGGGGKAVAIMWVKKEGVILTSVPYAHVLYRQYRGELCPHCCLVPPSASFQCGDCGEEYCSRRCLQAAAPVHELECSLLLAGGEPEDPTSWLLLRCA